MDKDLYVGSTKVTPVTLPNGLISVQLDGIEMKATAEQFANMAKEEPYDDGEISIKKWNPTIAKILNILTEDNLEMNDRDFVLQRVDTSILESYRAATAKLWNIPLSENVTMKMIGEKLTKV